MEDITKTGPVGLSGLKGINTGENFDSYDFANHDWTPINTSSNNWL
jgi:hypothetical protein